MIPTQIHNQVTDAISKCEGVFVWDFVIGTLMNYEVYKCLSLYKKTVCYKKDHIADSIACTDQVWIYVNCSYIDGDRKSCFHHS